MSTGLTLLLLTWMSASSLRGVGTGTFEFIAKHDQSGPEHGVPDACTAVIVAGTATLFTATSGANNAARNMIKEIAETAKPVREAP
jgi:hypothetical protein